MNIKNLIGLSALSIFIVACASGESIDPRQLSTPARIKIISADREIGYTSKDIGYIYAIKASGLISEYMDKEGTYYRAQDGAVYVQKVDRTEPATSYRGGLWLPHSRTKNILPRIYYYTGSGVTQADGDYSKTGLQAKGFATPLQQGGLTEAIIRAKLIDGRILFLPMQPVGLDITEGALSSAD
jgi:hypothetical protein